MGISPGRASQHQPIKMSRWMALKVLGVASTSIYRVIVIVTFMLGVSPFECVLGPFENMRKKKPDWKKKKKNKAASIKDGSFLQTWVAFIFSTNDP